MVHTRGVPSEIELAPIGVKLNGSWRAPSGEHPWKPSMKTPSMLPCVTVSTANLTHASRPHYVWNPYQWHVSLFGPWVQMGPFDS